MAQRRMFSKKITETDAFLDMSMSAQCLYFHLNMSADDDGFVGNSKTIKRMIGASDDDLRLLMAKEFIIPFESGVVVIKDWKIHNYIRKDRYNETVYKEEKRQLEENENGQYELGMTSGRPVVDQMDTQGRLGKDRLGKDRLGKLAEPQPDDENYINAWERAGFGMMSGFVMENLGMWIDDFDGNEDVVIAAIKEGAANTPDKPFKYIEGILKGWHAKGIRTLSDVEAQQKKWKKERKQSLEETEKKGESSYGGIVF